VDSRENAEKNHFHAETRRRGERHECAVIPACFWRESSVFCFSHEGTVYEFTTPLKKARSTVILREVAGSTLSLDSATSLRYAQNDGMVQRFHKNISRETAVHPKPPFQRACPRNDFDRGGWTPAFCDSASLRAEDEDLSLLPKIAVIPACFWRESSVFCFSHE
jgi:hypothetical protein